MKKKPMKKPEIQENVNEKKKHPGGRPTKYTPELGKRICELIGRTPYGIKKISNEYDFFPSLDTIYEWRARYPEFSEQYTSAKLKQADAMAEYCVDIADDSSQDIMLNKYGEEVCNTEYIARSRLRIDTRKWLASKLLPKQYGDKYILEQKNEENESLKEEIRKLREKLDAENKRDY